MSSTPLALQTRNAKVASSSAFTEAIVIKPNKSTVELIAKLASFKGILLYHLHCLAEVYAD